MSTSVKREPDLWNPRLVGILFPSCAVSVMNHQALSLSRYFPANQKLYM